MPFILLFLNVSGFLKAQSFLHGKTSVTFTIVSKLCPRLCRLLMDIGSQALIDTLDGFCTPENLHTFLSSGSFQSKLKSLRGKKKP